MPTPEEIFGGFLNAIPEGADPLEVIGALDLVKAKIEKDMLDQQDAPPPAE